MPRFVHRLDSRGTSVRLPRSLIRAEHPTRRGGRGRAGLPGRSGPDIVVTRVPESRRILFIRPSALGDVCRSVPVVASLRQWDPDARISWLVQRGFEDAVRCHPAVDEVIPFARREMARPWRPAAARRLANFVGELRRRRFDLVVDGQGLARSGLFTRLTGARQRVGFADAREGAWLAYTRRVGPPSGAGGHHAVDRMLALAAAVGAEPVEDLRLVVPPEGAAWWAAQRPADRGLVVLAPTARWRCKQWPAERFAALGRRILDAGWHVVLVGAPGEEAAVAAARPVGGCLIAPERMPAATGPSVVDLAGATSVGRMMAVLASAAVVVAGDSAALHMAAGLGVESVALFGPTDPALVGPRGGRSRVLRRVEPSEEPIRYRRLRDDDRFMRRIEEAEVWDAVRDRLAAGAARRESVVP
jgi:heptosyltransferase-1